MQFGRCHRDGVSHVTGCAAASSMCHGFKVSKDHTATCDLQAEANANLELGSSSYSIAGKKKER
jgi:hypothetical protein